MATKNPSWTYECPACHERVTVHVPLSCDPTCSKHTGGGKLMKLVSHTETPPTNHKEQ